MTDESRGKTDLTIGTDKVRLVDGKLVIQSHCDMIDWRATKYRKTLVIFNERTYFLARKSKLEDGSFQYRLEQLLEDYHDLPARTIVYDEEYVRERDALHKEVRKRRKIWMVLVFMQPLLGFLPFSMKDWLQDRYNLDPVSMTSYSLFLEYLFVALASSLYVIHLFTLALGRWFGYAPAVIILVLIDIIIRYHDVLAETNRPFGFYEWIFRMRLK